MSRRHVLAAMAAVPVAGALGVGTTAWMWWDRPAAQGLKALAQEEFDLVQALAEAWMPRGGEPELSGADANLGGFFDDLVAGMEGQTGTQLKLLLHLLDNATRAQHLAPYRLLPLETRIAVLRGWLDHPVELVRSAITAVMVLLSLGWTTHPAVVGFLRPYFRCGYGR